MSTRNMEAVQLKIYSFMRRVVYTCLAEFSAAAARWQQEAAVALLLGVNLRGEKKNDRARLPESKRKKESCFLEKKNWKKERCGKAKERSASTQHGHVEHEKRKSC